MPDTVTTTLVGVSLVWAAILTYRELLQENVRLEKKLAAANHPKDFEISWLSEEFWLKDFKGSPYIIEYNLRISGYP